MPGLAVAFRDVGVSFTDPTGGVHRAIQDVSLDIENGAFVSIVGPSGCGKTTLLKLVAGIETATEGDVMCEGGRVNSLNRRVGYIGQDSNLYPWLSVWKNIAFPLAVRGTPRAVARRKAEELIEHVGLAGFSEHYPHQLSGGMQKRVAIARTLIYEPHIILMDEPFGALDALTRMALQSSLQQMWMQRRPTILFVTHDLTEGIALSDLIVLISKSPGRIRQVFRVPLGRPRDIFDLQATAGFSSVYEDVWQHLKGDVLPAAAAVRS